MYKRNVEFFFQKQCKNNNKNKLTSYTRTLYLNYTDGQYLHVNLTASPRKGFGSADGDTI